MMKNVTSNKPKADLQYTFMCISLSRGRPNMTAQNKRSTCTYRFLLLTWLSLQSTERTNFVRAFFSDIKEKRNFHTSCFSSTSKVRVGGNLIIVCSNLHSKDKNQSGLLFVLLFVETHQLHITVNRNDRVLLPASPNSFSWHTNVVLTSSCPQDIKVKEDSSQKIIH